ncbi:ABC transporter substrate-binding protein [Alteribacter natronophilus]|uniref:ABC transporter substrate-binding protein n=1 Tax=Alteribacter natronophilus TaxID=2583810 RepID=UPI00110EECB5|nr:ABC transporter substrate-binding protein [Alteribacter natronophilus]TMW71674.1 ABC transporter substrate-binding protein [Alteribacter natronophilus]
MNHKWKVLSASLGALVFAACSADGEDDRAALIDQEWSDLEEQAEGTEVRLYMWGGDEAVNNYIDDWISPRVEEEYGLELTRIPMDAPEVLQRLQTEKQAGQMDGAADVIWINGENFRNAKERDLLIGPFADQLPNMEAYIDGDSLDYQVDFGTSVEGYEAPWGKVQFVFNYNTEHIDEPPENFEELADWIENNPGRFTYPEATDFTGNAFLRHLLYAGADDPGTLLEAEAGDSKSTDAAEYMKQYLTALKPNLWREGQTYPASLTDLDRLYQREEVWMTMGYNEARAVNKIADGTFPETTDTFVLDSGSIGNTHFLSIPFNASNPQGAMVLINELLSPEAQLEKLDPDGWGENTVLDISALEPEMRNSFEEIDRGESVPGAEVLQDAYLPELDAGYVPWLEEVWFEQVVKP